MTTDNRVDYAKLNKLLHRPGGEFSVVQFFEDGSYEYTRRFVTAGEAVGAFRHYCTSVGVKMGLVTRVIITDGGDCTCAEWKIGEGLTYPPKEECTNPRCVDAACKTHYPSKETE